MPISVEDKQAALLTAFKSPSVYKRIIEDNNSKVLPATEEMFSNLLVTNYGIIKTSSARAAKIFLENAKYLNVIDSSNRLRYIIPIVNSNGVDAPLANNEQSPPNNGNSNNPPPIEKGMVQILIPFKSGRKAYLHIPEDYSDDELTRVSKFVEALK